MLQRSDSIQTQATRRDFLKTTGALAAGLTLAGRTQAQGPVEKLALQGGP